MKKQKNTAKMISRILLAASAVLLIWFVAGKAMSPKNTAYLKSSPFSVWQLYPDM